MLEDAISPSSAHQASHLSMEEVEEEVEEIDYVHTASKGI